ncbi:MAG: C-terminal binding protein [Catonella sp.]|nr:C-terminal binding protein [Catonella sp.]MDY6357155.1 C-terminal binding protein [Catonella sp.]
MKNVLYFNVGVGLDYEKELLIKWGVTDINLIEIDDHEYKKSFRDYVFDTKANGLVVEYEEITREVIETCPDLHMIATQSIGYNNIDIEAAKERGVLVSNCPGFCADEVALHSVAMALDLARQITFLDRTVREGKWDPLLGYPMKRLKGQTFGLVFFGDIPKRMVPVLHSLGLNILVYAPTKTVEFLKEYGCVKAETIDELCEKSDFVSMHCPLIKDVTYHMMGEKQFKKMKKTAFFINTARGSVVDEEALVKALNTHEIEAAAIDVIEDEINEKSNLFGLPNVVMTPHSAFLSENSFYEARRRALAHLVEALSDCKVNDVEDAPVMNADHIPENRVV